jgi:Tol biopolymer transport system component/predicted Ser/Thr protein kinase
VIGQTIAHYTIIEHLGAGGMGDVYLAVDSKLDRKVALKFLPAQMTAQPDARARFLQEARAASALNHPNICTIHDIQEHDGQLFIVMEHVDGQTLRDKRATLSPKQVLEIGAQIADGLAAAHEHGIVHRDIKPENIMIRKDGIVQIMDFGLAKLHGATRLTKEGSTIGTAGYMSPEQVQGLDTDHRSDIFSLGVVLYELLTDQMPFRGMHDTAIMYEIVNIDAAPPSAIRPEIEPELDRILLECLDKDRDERYQSAKELAKDLRRFRRASDRSKISRVSTVRPALSGPAPRPAAAAAPAVSSAPKRGAILPWSLVGILMLAAGWLGWLQVGRAPATVATVRFAVPAPDRLNLAVEGAGNLALSPDGHRLAFVGADSLGTTSLWVRSINNFTSERLPGTDGALYPFWSPDSRFLCFFAEAKLKKIDVTGGPAVTLCDAPSGRGGSWSGDGVIIFAPRPGGGLVRVSAAGGVPGVLTSLDTTRGESTHRWPWFLPNGNHYIYYSRMGPGSGDVRDDSVRFAALDGSVDRAVMQCAANAAYASGHLIFLRERTLMAQAFDVSDGTLSGEPVPLAEDVYADLGFSNVSLGVSTDGTLAYQSGASALGAHIIAFDREGTALDTLGEAGSYYDCDLSPDDRYFAVEAVDPITSNADIWVHDITRQIRTRLTFAAGEDGYPAWTPDGAHILYSAVRQSALDLYRKAATGAGTEELLFSSSATKWLMDCSPDGRHLVYIAPTTTSVGDDLWILPLGPDGKAAGEPYAFQQTEFDEDDASFSPDGRWLAYASAESGEYEVYVRPFPGPGGKWQVSSKGGDFPRWRRDSRELYYISGGNMMTAVEIDGRAESITVGQPRTLFTVRTPQANKPYDVSADGRTFYIVTREAGFAASWINVVINWNSEIAAK